MTTNGMGNDIRGPRIQEQTSDHAEWQNEFAEAWNEDEPDSFDGSPRVKCEFFEDLSRFVDWDDEVQKDEDHKDDDDT
jgi:hypothetical protein